MKSKVAYLLLGLVIVSSLMLLGIQSHRNHIKLQFTRHKAPLLVILEDAERSLDVNDTERAKRTIRKAIDHVREADPTDMRLGEIADELLDNETGTRKTEP